MNICRSWRRTQAMREACSNAARYPRTTGRAFVAAAALFVGLFLGGTIVAHGAGTVRLALPDMNGKVHSLSDYRGKWVIVNYWATWCTSCQEDIPELEKFYERHKDRDAVVLGVNWEDIKTSWLRDFTDSMSMHYPILRSTPDPQTPFGVIMVLPTTFVLNPDGDLVARQVGPLTGAALDAYLERKRGNPAGTAPVTKNAAPER